MLDDFALCNSSATTPRMSNKQIILLDVDGLLANFVQGLIDTMSLPIKHDDWDSWSYHQKLGISDADMWAATHGDDWWLNLKPYPWAGYLVNSLKEFADVIYCTSPSLASDCTRQKIDWLRKHGFMSEAKNDYVIGPHKHLLARSGAILIDDSEANVSAFRNHSGVAWLFPAPWNVERCVDSFEMDGKIKSIIRTAWDVASEV